MPLKYFQEYIFLPCAVKPFPDRKDYSEKVLIHVFLRFFHYPEHSQVYAHNNGLNLYHFLLFILNPLILVKSIRAKKPETGNIS